MGKKQEEEPEHGEPAQFDPSFNGPLRKRSCTDIICLFLFLAVILGYIALGILAWLYGDPRHVLYPRNSTGWFCGVGPNKDKPNLFYFDILKCATSVNVMASALNGLQCPTTQVCVKQCPSEFWVVNPLDFAEKPDKVFAPDLCVPSTSLTSAEVTVKGILDKELCPFYYTPTSPVLGRCLPDLSALGKIPPSFTSDSGGLLPSINDTVSLLKNGTGDIANSFSAKDVGIRIFEDFASAWPWILLGLVIAMLVSMLFLLLLRFTAPVMVWLLIIGLLAAGAYGIWHCYWEYDQYRTQGAKISDVGLTTNVKIYLQVQETWLAFLIMVSVGEAIILLTLIFLRTRILIAIALIQESSKAIGHMMSALFYPLFTFVLLLMCVAYWSATALYLATSGEPVYKVVALNSTASGCDAVNGTVTCDPQVSHLTFLKMIVYQRKTKVSVSFQSFNSTNYPECPSARCIFITYNEEGLFQRNLFNLQIYNAIAFLWCVNFVIALGQCTLAGAFASYYWAFNKPDDIPFFPVTGSFLRSLRYHVGSLAFGALILTLVQIVRILLEYIDHKTRSAQNACARFILCCMKCCLWCLEKFIKFLNRNAYIMIAIYGKNFCVSAKNAFKLLMRNILRVVVLDKVTDVLLFFGKLLVVGGVGVLAFFFFSGRIQAPGNSFSSQNLNYYWMPIITVVFGSYLVAHGFFSVYSMCVDTLFLCFLEDLERNDGSVQKPYYMSKNLMKILNKSNKAQKQAG
ncbi:choline transporter-like protein 4 isoform X1 [Oryzias melastigma]|uniref:choline transporter-like protein 4 isoform X1 n=1 Tax=Oryzias melastigma TaxID=30732 RepID=UPI000CF7C76F|nr:choline transporter-like protein 4 isoform X1 [Oryzias melastigma]